MSYNFRIIFDPRCDLSTLPEVAACLEHVTTATTVIRNYIAVEADSMDKVFEVLVDEGFCLNELCFLFQPH